MIHQPHINAEGRRLAVEYRPIGDLIPYAKNARTNDEAHVAQIAASIRAFGWTNPILVSRPGLGGGRRSRPR